MEDSNQQHLNSKEDNPSIEDIEELNKLCDMIKDNSIEEISTIYSNLYSSAAIVEGNGSASQEPNLMSSTSNMIDNGLLSLTTQDFKDREELLACVRDKVLLQGYVTTIKRSKKNRYVIIGCDRGGKYRRAHILLEVRKRTSSSRLIDCPFEIWGKQKVDGSWKVKIKNMSHNHEPSNDVSGHPYARRFTEEELSRIKEMTMARIPPRQILISLRQKNPKIQAIARTVYNAKAKIIKESLDGRTMIQALVEELGQGEFIYDIENDGDGRLTHLFFAHPYSVVLTRNYPNVFVMDCTYKTNKYKMPLLEVVRVSSFNSSFSSCLAFIREEKEKDYVWALERFAKLLGGGNHPLVIITDRELALMKTIEMVFPITSHILCLWHIEKNILANCKNYFKEKMDWDIFLSIWTSLVRSSNEFTFDEGWSLFEVQFADKPVVLNYIKSTWLPFKDRFVDAWTEKNMHFGNRVSSRVEGAQAMIKRYLQVSTGNLRQVKGKICFAIENQYKEIKAQLASEKVHFCHKFHIPFLKNLLGQVSMFALGKLHKQYMMAMTEPILPPCKGQFSSTMGLPCAHKMKEENFVTIEVIDIHSQWRLDTKSFVELGGSSNDQGDGISDLLQQFHDKYKKMSLIQKKDT